MVERLVAPESPIWYQKTGRWESGPTTAYYKGLMSILTGEPYPLRVLNASCTNPLSATRNPKKVAEALKKLDFMFVMDVFHAPHVDFADIVLPACTSYEQGDFFGVRNTPEGVVGGGLQPGGRAPGGVAQRLAVLPRSGRPHGLRRALLAGRAWTASWTRLLARYGVTVEQLRQNPGGMLVAGARAAGPAPPQRRRAPRAQYRKYALLFKDLPHGKVQCYNELIGGKENNDRTRDAALSARLPGPARGPRRDARNWPRSSRSS